MEGRRTLLQEHQRIGRRVKWHNMEETMGAERLKIATTVEQSTLSEDAAQDAYQRRWSASQYLREYYSGASISDDECANAKFIAEQLRALGRTFPLALEFGCGPTVHHGAALAPYVKQLHLADYLPENLAEIRRWLSADPQAHDWDPYLMGVLAAEGLSSPEALSARKALLRTLVTEMRIADIRCPVPLRDPGQYDLVASYYCAEAVATSRAEWRTYLAHLAGLVAPAGLLLMGAARHSQAYRVLDYAFAQAHIDETDFASELPALGFPASGTVVEIFNSGWQANGFESICCVRAIKTG
jgi:hypothetical protein